MHEEKEGCVETKSPHRGRKLGEKCKLSKKQEAVIFGLMTTRRPFQLGFQLPYKGTLQYLWSRDLLRQLIDQKFQIKLSDGGVVVYLARWGFPALVRSMSKYDQCHKSIRGWLDIHYAELIARSKSENAQLYWMGVNAPVGLPSQDGTKQKSLTMIPVIENQGRVHWMTIKGQFKPERQVMFLNSLAGQSRTKVFLIRNSTEHFAKDRVANWLNENGDRIEIFPPPKWDHKLGRIELPHS